MAPPECGGLTGQTAIPMIIVAVCHHLGLPIRNLRHRQAVVRQVKRASRAFIDAAVVALFDSISRSRLSWAEKQNVTNGGELRRRAAKTRRLNSLKWGIAYADFVYRQGIRPTCVGKVSCFPIQPQGFHVLQLLNSPPLQNITFFPIDSMYYHRY
jgi:hypothetical protein